MSRSFASFISRRTAGAIVTTVCLAAMFIAASAAHAQGLYQSPSPNLPTGTTPQGVASADFALSGYQSLVVTDKASNNIKVYLATGAGTFAPAVTYPTCAGPTVVLAGDADGDGYPDIAVACTGATTNNIYLFINDGTGHFGTSYPFTANHPVAMTHGDFLGNGTEGLAVAGSNGVLTILLNVGGTETTKTITSSGTFSGIVTADFNHDGHLDLAVSDSANNTVHVFTGNGTGNFTQLGTYSTGTGTKPSGIVTADFNHDGNADVATSNAGNSTATILLGSATGALTAQTAQAAGLNPIAIATADVNSDGNPDVIAFDGQNTTLTAENAVLVLLGTGTGTLQTAQISNLSDTPGLVANVADFNRDGKPDLAITQQNNNQVSLLLNNTLPTAYPDGRSFSSAKAIANGHGNMADSIATGDFNKDGRLDIAVSYLEDNVVSVLTNNGAGGFNTAVPYAVGQQPYDVVAGDLNGDGYPDLVAVNTSLNSPTGTVSVLLNNRNGTFAAAATYTVGRLPYQVAISDVNGDGYPDLAVTNYGANTVSILYGSKTGTFTTGPTLTTGTNPYGVAIGNFSGKSGYGDVAVTCYNTSQLYVFPNQGNGTFGSPFITSTDSNPTSLVVGDFNRDGKLDIVTGNSTANDISFFAGNGSGGFAAGVTSPSLNFPDSIAAGDVNGDGILDIVGVAPNFNAVEVTLGVGDGTFGTFHQRAAGEFTATKQPWAVALGDFNNDGQLDIVTANTYNQVNLALPAYQQRYMTEYPPVAGGNPSIDLLTNYSGANISLAFSPTTLPANNTGTTITATVAPAIGGATPTGSVGFEDINGDVLGASPYDLTLGVATYATGHLGSGSYLFTTLYSGDANFQPTTVSGSAATITVAGTPVTLSLSPSSVGYGSNFTATATVIGNATTGSFPKGTATIYISSGGTFTAIGTTGNLTQIAGNHTSSATITLNNNTPYLAIGSYELYAIYNPSGASLYATGSSPEEPLTVTINSTTTSITICGNALLVSGCTGQVSAPGANPGTGTVALTVNGVQVATGTVGGNGGFTIGYTFNFFTQYFITATYQGTANYSGSTSDTYSLCELCGLSRNSPLPLNSFSGLGAGGFGPSRNNRTGNRNVPFTFF